MGHLKKETQTSRRQLSSFFAERYKTVEKMVHQKKNTGHQTSMIVKFRQSYSSFCHLPYHCSFHYLAHALMHYVACEFVRSKDAQKQLARRSLKDARTLAKRQNQLVQLPEVCKMHKTMVFGLLFFITFLAIVGGNGAAGQSCTGSLAETPVNSSVVII